MKFHLKMIKYSRSINNQFIRYFYHDELLLVDLDTVALVEASLYVVISESSWSSSYEDDECTFSAFFGL